MTFEELKNIIPEITQDDIINNSDVEIYSAYGGKCVGYILVSEIDEVLKNEERQVGLDFYMRIIR